MSGKNFLLEYVYDNETTDPEKLSEKLRIPLSTFRQSVGKLKESKTVKALNGDLEAHYLLNFPITKKIDYIKKCFG